MSYESAMKKLDEVIVGAGGQATIPFSSIDQRYRSLIVILVAASDQASNQFLKIQFNGDTGINYSRNQTYSSGGSVGDGLADGETSLNYTVWLPKTSLSPAVASAQIVMPCYTTAFWKNVNSQNTWVTTTLGGLEIDWEGGVWKSTAAITSILMFPASGNFVEGSVCSLYALT